MLWENDFLKYVSWEAVVGGAKKYFKLDFLSIKLLIKYNRELWIFVSVKVQNYGWDS